MGKIKILFFCIGNSARSQMAEALLRTSAGDRFEVYSAGIEPKGINPYAKQVLAEVGIDLSGQYSKSIHEYMGRIRFDYLITLCGDADEKCPAAAFPVASQRMHWPFEDPATCQGSDEEKLVKFRQVRDQIDQTISAWLKRHYS
ncbi:MAG: arsenate reductase ArsC [bacterium]